MLIHNENGVNYGYFGGNFTEYNGSVMNGLGAFNSSDGSIKSGCDFAGLLNVSAYVNSIAHTETHIIIGGQFSSYAGTPVQNIAKINKTTCKLDETFTKQTGFDSDITTMVISGNSLYVGGYFTGYRVNQADLTYNSGGGPAQSLAKIDLTTGNLDTTFTQPTGLDNGPEELLVFDGSLYVGGYFSNYRGVPAEKLAKVNLTTGNLDTTFTQSSGFEGNVYSLTAHGGKLYVGGNFQSYRGSPARSLAKIDATTGDLDTTFTQSTGVYGDVYSLVVSEGSLYVGGGFSDYRITEINGYSQWDESTGEFLHDAGGGQARGLAKMDLTTGNLDTTFTQSTGVDGFVYSLVVNEGSLYVGGYVNNYRFNENTDSYASGGGLVRGLAKVNLISGNLDGSFSLSHTEWVQDLKVSNGIIYVVGNIRSHSGLPVERIAKVNLSTGELDSNFSRSAGFESEVWTLLISGSSLYVGGAFSYYRSASWTYDNELGSIPSGYLAGGGPARYLAKIDLTTGNLDTTFTQSTGFNNSVRSMVSYSGSLYVGGYFGNYRGSTVNSLAKLDLTTGVLDSAFSESSNFYMTGESGISSIPTLSGEQTQRFSQSNGSWSSVESLFLEEGSSGEAPSLYIAGDFSQLYSTFGLGDILKLKLDFSDGKASGVVDGYFYGWVPEGVIYSVIKYGNYIYIGGQFDRLISSDASYMYVNGIAKLNADGTPDETIDGFNSKGGFSYTYEDGTPGSSFVMTLATDGISLFAGGTFKHYGVISGAEEANMLAKLSLSDGTLDTAFSQASGLEQEVSSLLISGDSLYVGGQFTKYRGQNASYLMRLNKSTGAQLE